MIDASLTTTAGQKCDLRLPSCSLSILQQLERAALVIEQAMQAEQNSIELTFYVKGKSTRLKVSTLYD